MKLPENWKRIDHYAIAHSSGLLRISKSEGKKRTLYTVWRKTNGEWFRPPEPHHTDLEKAIKQAEGLL